MKKNNSNSNYITLQITLFNTEGKYKPVSTLITIESIKYYKEHKKEINNQAIVKICQKRNWTAADLLKYGYTALKVRNYDLLKKTSEGKKENDEN